MLKLLAFLTLILHCSAHAEPSFNEGLEAFQKGDYDSSQRVFQTYLKDPKLKYAALYNLGVTAAKLKKPGEALAYFRKALALHPRDKDLNQNYHLVEEQFKILPPSGNISGYDVFQTEFLDHFTFNEFALAALVFMIFFATTLVSFLKKRAVSEEKPFPPAKVFVWGGLFVVSFAFVILKLADTYTETATVIVTKAELKSGPDNNNAALAEINEGAELLVKQTISGPTGTWKQVTIPGNLTGWVSDKSVMVTSGGGPW